MPPVVLKVFGSLSYVIFGTAPYLHVAFTSVLKSKVTSVVPEAKAPDGAPFEGLGAVVGLENVVVDTPELWELSFPA